MPPVPSSPDQAVLSAIHQDLQEQLGQKKYVNWFGGSTRLELAGSELLVHAQSPYLAKWLQKQFHSQLGELCARHVGPSARVSYRIADAVLLTTPPNAVAPSASDTAPLQRSVARTSSTKSRQSQRRLLRLDDFVTGDCNELAFAAALQVADQPGEISPLYLHSTVGNGKSHLLEGIRQRMRKLHPGAQVMLITAEQFTNYFTQALTSRTLPSFRQRFRGVEMLLVDDVDFFDGKKGTQEEFLHTIKQFEMDHRQVVVSANRHPRLLTRTSDELISRYVSGLVCRIDVPDDVTRTEIVRRCATRSKTKFQDSAIEYVAGRFKSNVRELEGAVNVLATWAQMSKRPVTAAPARQLLSRLERDCMKVIRLTDIEAAVCDLFGVDSDELKSKSRKQTIAQPRMLAMYLSRRLTEIPYSEIGKHFGGRNHSTVMSAERKIDEQLTSDSTIRLSAESWKISDLVETLKDRIRA